MFRSPFFEVARFSHLPIVLQALLVIGFPLLLRSSSIANRMPIDYSKFDAIEDSDDEDKSKNKVSKEGDKKSEPKKPPTCPNCYKEIAQGKAMRCGRCKQVSYCSQKCQAEDWQFHKRVCAKEAPAKSKEPAPPVKPKPEVKKAKEEKVVEEDDDVGTWYRHRDWKPEQKQEFKPVHMQQNNQETAQKAPVAGSAWNAAGTWEDSDETEWAKSRLPQMLVGHKHELPGCRVSLEVEKVDNFGGDASISTVRGVARYLFDLTFTVHVVARWMGSDGSRTAKAKIKILEFTDNLAHTFVEAEGFPCEVSTEGGADISLSTMLREPTGFQNTIFQRMLEWVKEFQNKGATRQAG